MANDKRYTDLPTASSISSTDIMAMVDPAGNITYQFTFAQLMTFLSSNFSTGANISYGTVNPTTGGNNGDIFINTSSNQFLQKIAGTWTVIYTVAAGVVGTQFTFQNTDPSGATTGNNGDVIFCTGNATFYKNTSTGSGTTWTLQFAIASGPAGPRGNSILNGPANPAPTDGNNGDFWINTTSNTLFGPKAAGVWPGTGLSLVPGTPNTLLNGTTAPSNTLGNNGDFYLNTSAFTWYGPKAGGVWPAGIALGDSGGGSTVVPVNIPIPAGSAYPLQLDFLTDYQAIYGDDPIIEVWTDLSAVTISSVAYNTQKQIFDVDVQRLKDPTTNKLTWLMVYGHSNGAATPKTLDNIYLIIRYTNS